MIGIRLACSECDRDDGDGLMSVEQAVARGWTEVLEDRRDDPEQPGHWWDHIGICLGCRPEE